MIFKMILELSWYCYWFARCLWILNSYV